ncbi:MAG: AAA family ATPase [Rhodobacteraceae bacterium]|nr:AAA family ATPase [Paracoccaceae bacterium]
MLKKIISVRNVGRFRNSTERGNPQFKKYTFIYGANGSGKTTLCAVLRSLQTGDPAHILGRKTVAAKDAPLIELDMEGGQARFNDAEWNTPRPEIAIFDGVFVTENVYFGEIVGNEHKRNLYRIIIGAEGAKLARQADDLATKSRAKTSEVSTTEKNVQQRIYRKV